MFDNEILSYAIELCVLLQNKKTFAYLEGILKNWKSQQYKTLEEIKDNEKPKGEEPPAWFNKEIKVDALSKTEISEMEDLLNEFK